MVSPGFLPRARLDEFIGALGAGGRRVVGPRIDDGAIVLDEVRAAAELPVGARLRTAPGMARLERTDSPRVFDHPVSFASFKAETFPARIDALSLERTDDGGVRVRVHAPDPEPVAFLGARACDLAAIAVQDRVLADGAARDPDYVARRPGRFVVAVECAVAGSTCFCTSMGTGPEVSNGADIVLSELDAGFVVRAASEAGSTLLDGLGLAPATEVQEAEARAQVAATRRSMGDGVVAEGLPERLLAALDDPRWEACLACGNCTLACPTCFCTGLVTTSDMDGRVATASRTWDSCFTEGFAQVAGGNFRPNPADRYRQWLTHKFATWWTQFGTSGCVGCGRCITWCPVGIDVRAKLATLAPADASAVRTVVPVPFELGPAPARPGPRDIGLGFSPATVVDVHPETPDTTTLRLATDEPALRAGRPGQFVMVGMPGFSIPPISVSRFQPDGLELTVRAAGAATSVLARLSRGAVIGLRGPLGRPWPLEDAVGRDVVVVGGGIGLAPLRPLIDALLADRDRFGAIRLYLGARTPRDRLFVEELDAIARRDDLLVRSTVDRAGPEWFGRVGIVTGLFSTVVGSGSNVTAFVCGPERMMMATADVLGDLGVPPERTWLTLERRMECGVGLCGHCQMAGKFVCRDGPVFSLAELGDGLRREGW
jgi:NAD(P)H-flavin reductase